MQQSALHILLDLLWLSKQEQKLSASDTESFLMASLLSVWFWRLFIQRRSANDAMK